MATKKKTKKKPPRPSFSVCLWGLEESTPKGAIIHALLKEMSIPVRSIKENQLGDAAGSVAGLIGFRPSLKPFEGEAYLDEFILFNNVPSKTVQAFLKECREKNCVVDHKAIITKFNKTWPLDELMFQIALEHAQANSLPLPERKKKSDQAEDNKESAR